MTVGNATSIAPIKNAPKLEHSHKTFSQVLAQKKAPSPEALPAVAPASLQKVQAISAPMGTTASALKKVLNNMVNNHETALASIKEAMSNNDQSPEKLLTIQFKTGAFFLREQMFCKTAELFTNTLKNFTQMQV